MDLPATVVTPPPRSGARVPARARLLQRAQWAWQDDFHHVQPRLWLAHHVAMVLPPYVGARLRVRLLRFAGAAIGARTVICGDIVLSGEPHAAAGLTIGSDCFINVGCHLDMSAAVAIGDDVAIGHRVGIVTSSHEIGPSRRRAGPNTAAPVTIGSGAWIGSRAVILPGVTVGAGSIVAAGSVVTRPVPANVVVGGVPARVMRDLP